jgi:hypothetical protein
MVALYLHSSICLHGIEHRYLYRSVTGEYEHSIYKIRGVLDKNTQNKTALTILIKQWSAEQQQSRFQGNAVKVSDVWEGMYNVFASGFTCTRYWTPPRGLRPHRAGRLRAPMTRRAMLAGV